SLEPFDFAATNPSGELWLAEGFSNYYGLLALLRAGITDLAEFCRQLSVQLNAVINSPARQRFDPVEMSMQAAFVDGAAWVDAHDQANTYCSYESWGALLALSLELILRTEHATSLDAFMRELWHRHG